MPKLMYKNQEVGGVGSSSNIPVGSIISFSASGALPQGYLECDGSAVSRVTYPDLFAAIGTTYGSGDGSTTFNLPDHNGKFVKGSTTPGTNAQFGSTGTSYDSTTTRYIIKAFETMIVPGQELLPKIKVTAPTGTTVTVSNGVTTLNATEVSGVWMFTIPAFGTWTVTCDNGNLANSKTIDIFEVKMYTMDILPGLKYGFRIKKSESSPTARVEYLYDAVGLTPAYMDTSTGTFNYGSWGDKWFVTDNKPLMLNNDGTVAYYLNPTDYTKKEIDGTASDIANTSFAGNAMAQFPLVWVYRYQDDTYEYEIISNMQIDSNYKAYAHTKADGTIADYFYWSIFGGSGNASKIRSLSGQTLAQSLTAANEIAGATANGTGWYTHTWSQHELIRTLLILMGKSTDTQAVFGNGNLRSASSASGMLATGTLNDKGQFWGTTANSTSQVKVFHIEKFWGDQWDRIAGIINSGGKIYAKMTPEGDGYRVTDTNGYTNTNITLSGTNGGYVSACNCSEYGIIPTTISGSASTYYCDGGWFNNSQLDYLLVGVSANDASGLGGAFAFDVDDAPSYATWNDGCGLSYIG